jgi:hypothetical protein
VIRRDRELLARLTKVNINLGHVLVEVMHEQDGGELPADGLRTLGQRLMDIGGDMITRADELDAVIDAEADE